MVFTKNTRQKQIYFYGFYDGLHPSLQKFDTYGIILRLTLVTQLN